METKIKLLILEHDPNDLELLLYELKKNVQDFSTEVVQTKAAYEKSLHEYKPDIILSDYSLPSFDGLTAFRIKQERVPETPFIIVSGTIGEDKAVDMIKMGVTDYVLKDKMYQMAPKIFRALNECSDRRRKNSAELQLKQREEHLQKIMDLSLDVICTLDQDGVFVTVSAASKLVFDYLPEELTGRRILDLVHADDKGKVYQAVSNLKKGIDIINLEYRFIRRSGASVTLLWSARWDEADELGYGIAKDVTDIKRAAENLKNNERRFRTLLQNSNDGFSLITADGTLLERSSSAYTILELDANENYNKPRLDLVHPEDVSLLENAVAQVKNNPADLLTIELRFRKPDGTFKWLEVSIHNQLQEPAVGAIVFNYRDITERKLAAMTLEKSEARLKEAQAIGHIGNWEMNLADGNSIWSDEMFRILGSEKGAIIPSFNTLAAFIHPEDRAAALAKFDQASKTRTGGTTDFRIISQKGEIRYVVSEWRFLDNDSTKGSIVFGILQDITQGKLIELELEKSEEKYRILFDLSPSPNWLLDAESFRFLDVNQAAISHYGYSKSEFLNMALEDILHHEEVKEFAAYRDTKHLLFTNHGVLVKHQKKDGKEIYVDIKSRLIELGGKAVWLALATDISERLKYTEAIEEQNIKLRDIAWIQSHVVRAPLARIMGLVNVLSNYKTDEARASSLLHSISTSAQELDEIIKEIVSKAEKVHDQPMLQIGTV